MSVFFRKIFFSIHGILLFCFLSLLSVLMYGCKPNVATSSNIEYMVDSLQVAKQLSGKWVVVPLLPLQEKIQPGNTLEDYGGFLKVLADTKKGHQAKLWDRSALLHPIQERAFLEYLEQVRQNRLQSDSLLAMLRGNENAKVLFALLLTQNLLTQTEEGKWKRKVLVNFKALDYKSGQLLLKGSVAAQHEATEKLDLYHSEILLKSCFKALIENLKFNSVAGLAPKTNPDF